MATDTPTTTKSSFWICTLNNPTDDERALLKSPPHYIKEMWGQDEKAPTTGTLHIQIGMRTDQVRKSVIVNDFPRMWIGKANSKKGLIEYVSKQDSSIPGTQWHYVLQTNEITEPEQEYLSGHQILEMIAFWVRETDNADGTLLLQPEQMYEQAINDICTYQPDLATKVCGTRILPMWKLLFRVFLHRVNLLSNVEDEEVSIHPEWQGICEGCDKDECLPCGLIYLSKL